MRRGGDSYYVLVNNKGKSYTVFDPFEGETTLINDTFEAAENDLDYLIDEGELDTADGWHVERHRW